MPKPNLLSTDVGRRVSRRPGLRRERLLSRSRVGPTSSGSARYLPHWSKVGGLRIGSYWEGYGPKVGRRVHNRSDLEHDYYVLLESDPDVATYCEEPLTVSAVVAGRRVRSRFDFWVRFADGHEEFVEVKYAREVRDALPGTRTWFQLETQKAWCAAGGLNHRLRDETTIRAEPRRLENWKQILGYLSGGERDAPSPRMLAAGEALWTWLDRRGGGTLGEVEDALRGSAPGVDARECLFRLLHAGRVVAPEIGGRLLDARLRFEARV